MRFLRKVFAIVLALFLIGGVAGLASAAVHGGAPEKQEEKPAAEKAAKPAGEKARHHDGKVKAVDAAAKTLTVEERSGDATVTVTDTTVIRRGQDSLMFEDLQAGDQVTVVYVQQNGKDVARHIIVKAE